MDAGIDTTFAELVGSVLGERYRIESRLSAGGMGVVYRARHVVLDSTLAVKVLHPSPDPLGQQRFLQEAKLASTLNHPNTVRIIDFGVLPGGRSYLVMEFLQGRTLSNDIVLGPIDLLRVCNIGVQIARGLQAVHDQDIVHRDVKPDNVFLLNQDGTSDFVKLVDFGIAKAFGTKDSPIAVAEQNAGETALADTAPGEQPPAKVVNTQVGAVIGTPPYMSPEQCAGEPVDARADQYSVGCMLYEMLTGECPFESTDLLKLLRKHITAAPLPPRVRAPQRNIPEALEAVVLRMLAKHPEQRFDTMRDVAQALQQVADAMLIERGVKPGLPALPTPPGLPGPLAALASKPETPPTGAHFRLAGRRVPALAAVLLVIAVMSVGGVGYLGWRLTQTPKRQTQVVLEPGELQTIKARALAVLRQQAQGQGTDGDALVRQDAIAALGRTKDAALVPLLVPLLADPAVQVETAAALGRLGERSVLGSLQTLLGQTDRPLVRLAVARALLDLGEPSGEETLVRTLGQGSPEERLRAASLLCDRHNAAAEQLLLQVVDQGLLKEEQGVLAALGCLLGSQSADAARTRLQKRLQAAAGEPQKIAVARVLAGSADEAGRRVLRELMARPGPARLPAAQALAAADVPEAGELFRSVLRDPQAEDAARLLASAGLGQSGRLIDVRLLEPLLRSKSATVQGIAAAAVLQLAAADPTALGAESLRWARGSLRASDWRLRESAALVLGDSSTPEAVALLGGMLKDDDARVRRSSARALGRRAEEAVLQTLQEALHDADTEVRIEAMRSLGQVSQRLRDRGKLTSLERVTGWLRDLVKGAPSREQIVARMTLLGLGDTSQAAALRDLQQTPDPALRRFLLEQIPANTERALALLSDADAGVRFAAAQQLAEAGDIRAVAVLTQTLNRNDADSIAAYGLLRKLGHKVAPPPSLQSALSAGSPVLARMAAIESMMKLPAPLAVPLLLTAAHDPEPLVRRLCAEVAADLPEGAEGPPGFPVLHFLIADDDPVVRNRAAALLARLTLASAPPSTAPSAAAAAVPNTTNPADVATTPESGGTDTAPEPPEAGGTESGAKGTLVLEAPEGLLFQLDDKKWQTSTGRGIPVGSGAHHITTLGGEYDVNVETDKKAHLKVSASAVDEAVQSGSRAYQQKEYGKAQKYYDRAIALCGHKGSQRKACTLLELELALDRGHIFEEQKRLAEAMVEYQKAVDHGRGKVHTQAAEAMNRLSPRLGKVVLRSQVSGKCKERVQWLLPGKKQKVKVGDKSQPVNVQAGQTVNVGECP